MGGRRIGAIVVGVAVVVTAACGRGTDEAEVRTDTPVEAGAALAESIRTTKAEASFRVHQRVTGGVPEGVCTTGAQDVVQVVDPGSETMVDLDERGAVTAVQQGDDLYLTGTGLPATWTTPRPWLHVGTPSSGTSTLGSADADLLVWFALLGAGARTWSSSPSTSDPGTLFDLVERSASSVVLVGEEPVDGVPATRYHAELDAQRMFDATAPEGFPGSLPPEPSFPVPDAEVWVGTDHLVRRMDLTFTLDPSGGSGPEASTETPFTASLTFSDFGTALPAGVPDAADVAAAGELPASVLIDVLSSHVLPGCGPATARPADGGSYERCLRDEAVQATAGLTVAEYAARHPGGVFGSGPGSACAPALPTFPGGEAPVSCIVDDVTPGTPVDLGPLLEECLDRPPR